MRKTMYRKILSIITAVAMLLTCSTIGGGSVFAAEKTHKDASKAISAINSGCEQSCADNQAIVMFDTNKTGLTKKEAKAVICSSLPAKESSRFTVKETLNFESAPDANPGEATAMSASKENTTVALVGASGISVREMVKELRECKGVAYAEPNYRTHILSVSSDEYSDMQWSMQDGVADVSYEWNDKGTSGTDKIVALVDTGVDYTHEDLQGRIWKNTHYPALKGENGFDFANIDNEPMDDNGHGTHCAGIIGAAGNNSKGISGVCRDKVKIMPLKTFDQDGASYTWNEISAYNYINKAIDLGENVVAVNNSWGGSESSAILEELVNILGEKGAVSICAAGNEGANNDEEPSFPANIDSPYVISVAATKEDGQLASYSNYGENNVDIAAPGTDILSTVSYNCYNPGIYSSSRQATVSNIYESYDACTAAEQPIMPDSVYANGIPEGFFCENGDHKVNTDAECTASAVSGFGSDTGKALHIKFKNLEEDDIAFVKIPYTAENADPAQKAMFSAMVKIWSSDSEAGFATVFDAPQSKIIDYDTMEDYDYDEFFLNESESDYWNHLSVECMQEAEGDTAPFELQRYIYIGVYAAEAGDFDLVMDDMGISKENCEEQFGRYDFYSGTSMATPFVTGAYALKAAEMGDKVSTLRKANTVASMADASKNLKVKKGSINFTKVTTKLAPMIVGITVNTSDKTIRISGDSLKNASVDIGGSGNIKPVKQTDTYVTVANKGWINNVKDVTVKNANGKDVRKQVYLVKGKKDHKLICEGMPSGDEELEAADVPYKAITTDGKNIYAINSGTDSIVKADIDGMYDMGTTAFEEVGSLAAENIFDTSKESPTASYGMELSDSMAYANGRLYFVAGYGELTQSVKVESSEYEEDGWWIEEESFSLLEGLYTADYRLVSMNTSTGKIKVEKKLPSNLLKRSDWTMAAYNGKLYFLGGYSYDSSSKGLKTTVNTYNPATGKWGRAASLPEARGFGHAVQTGNRLVYSLGYNKAGTCPKTLIFNGTTWKTASKSIKPFHNTGVVERGNKEYKVYDAAMGACKVGGKPGVVFTGLQVADYGDTFRYNLGTGNYSDTGYAFSKELGTENLTGIAMGSRFINIDGNENISYVPVKSALVKVKTSKKGKGTVTKTRSYVPGSKAKIKAKAKKGYYVKSIKVGSKTYKYKKKLRTRTVTVRKAITKDVTVKVIFAKKR